MKLVFALYKYFPFGGLQRDMLAIAQECAARGHQVSIFCQSWSGELPETPGINVNVMPDKKRWWMSRANHRKNARFIKMLNEALERIQPDRVVGFNRIPGVDLYYAADTCFKAKLYVERPWVYRFLPRYRQFVQDEAALFLPDSTTHILAIAQTTLDEYQRFYKTPEERFTLLPPGISRDRINSNDERLSVLHDELHLDKEIKIVLMVGSGFRTKGLDRAINALAALPEGLRQKTHLVVVGEDKGESFIRQARILGVTENIHFLGGRKDIPRLLKSADLLLHPAYRENTGTVLLEAAAAQLPVIATVVCGYAQYIAKNNFGATIPEPFQQRQLDGALAEALTSAEQQESWRKNAKQFADTADIYDMPAHAVNAIEKVSRTMRARP